MKNLMSVRLSSEAQDKLEKMMEDSGLTKTACINSLILERSIMIDGKRVAEELFRLRLFVENNKENSEEIKKLVKLVTSELYKILGGSTDGDFEEY